jgi:hypothetical protein
VSGDIDDWLFEVCCFFIFGLCYLVLLAANLQAAIIFGVFTVVYVLWWRQQRLKAAEEAKERRVKAEKEAEERRIKAEKEAEEQKVRAAREAEEQRKQAIALARQREDLYEYDSSIQLSHQRSTKNIFKTPSAWAASIEARYEEARRHLLDADLVFNDDVYLFNQYRKQLQTELIPKYEDAIRPFFNDLCLKDKDIPTPRELKAAVDFVYPYNLQPAAIHQKLAVISQILGQNMARNLQGKNLMKLEQKDVMSLAITAAISGVHYLFTISQQRTALEKVQGEVDLKCEEISGAIKTYGRLSENLRLDKSKHESVENYLMRYLNEVIRLSSEGKVLIELQELDQKLVEQCYRGGQLLKQILQKDVITPINDRN